jgi:PAS domain S-box-containing protein
MEFQFFDEVKKKPYLVQGLIAVITTVSLLINIYGLLVGITIVLPHLFYIPIVLTSYYYPRRGLIFTIILSVVYCGIVLAIGHPSVEDMIAAAARSVVFIAVAAVVAYLGKRIQSDTQMCRRLVSVVESSQDAIVGETLDGIVTDWNAGAENLYGYTSDEMTGTSIFRIIHPDRKGENLELLDRIRHGETIERHEAERVTKSGKIIQTSLSLSPIKDNQGVIIGASVIAHDITGQKEAERKIQESEEKFREIFNSVNDAIHLHEIDDRGLPGRFIDVNNMACEIFQYGRDELLTKSPLDFTIEYHSRPLEEIGNDLKDRGYAIFETGFIRRDGTVVPVEIHAHVVTILGKKMVISVARDIRRRKEGEMALRRLAADHKAIIDNTPAMVWYKDTSNNFIRVNPAAARAFGLSVDEIEGKNDYELFPEMAETYYRDDLEVIHSGIPKNGVMQMHTASGEVLWVRTDKIPLKNEKGEVTGLLVFVVDITERKKAEDSLALAGKKLNLMSSITRHDILNQLTVLLGYIELSEREEQDPTLLDYLKREKNAAETIGKQIRFTRDYQDMGVKEPGWQNVSTIVGYVTSTIPMKQVAVEVDLTGLEVFADPLFEKVFYNLIDNAMRYGGDSLTTIRICSEVCDDNLVIIVEDNGSGISAEDKKHIFTRGFGKHTGLGLFLSREILSITGMTISETGITGKGARFEILVPKGMYRFSVGK